MLKKQLFHYFKPYKIPLILFMLCVLITSASVLAIGKGISYFVDYGISSHDPAILLRSLAVLLTIVVILAFATFGRFFLITYFGEKVICDIRRDLFSHLMSLSIEFYEKNKIGELISRVTSDLSILQSVLSSSVSIFIRNFLLFIGGIVILITINPFLTLIVFMTVPVVVLPILLLGKKLRVLSRKSQDKVSNMSAIMEENLSFIKLIQSFSNEKFINQKFTSALKELLLVAKSRILLRSLLTVTVIIIVFLGVAVILYRGASLVFTEQITVGEFSQFLFYTVLVAGAFAALSEVFGSIQKARGSTQKIFELLNVKSQIIDGEESVDSFESLEFKNVSFQYPTRSEHSLTDLNFSIKAGDSTAIVGHSGAGKTTIFELLQRFYDVSEGSIEVNGKDIKSYKLKDLRSLFAISTQENAIFSSTVKENLIFADQSISNAEMRIVAQQTMSDDFINKLPDGYDSFLGEKGVRISSGEKQRIALARAALKKAPILLLDEPTSNLDSYNEKLFQEFLTKYRLKHTIIVIAHRLSTIKNLNKIIVIDSGKVAEYGSHEDLLKIGKIYKKLVDLQFK